MQSADKQSQADHAISFDWDLDHPPEKVWRALTDPALLAEWLLPVVGHKLAPGASFIFKTEPQPGWDGIVNCRYLEIEAYKRISWSWVVGEIDTVVTMTLSPVADGTRLSLVQSGFREDQKKNAGGARYGWKMMSAKLIEILAQMA